MTNNRFNARLNFSSEIYPDIIRLISEIDSLKTAFKVQSHLSPQIIDRLTQSVLITSAGSSTRIEGSLMSDEDVKSLYKKLRIQKFKTRDEQEVAGYLETLSLVFETWKGIKFNENVIKQLHSLVLKYSAKDSRHKGNYKFQNNKVQATDHQGNVVQVIFEPTPPYLVPKEMQELMDWLHQELKGRQHPLLLIANFLFEFLAIHPFEDGNGRTSRILTNLLLLQAGYEFTPFVSHEKIVESNKIQYYQALNFTQITWKTDKEDMSKWVVFFLEVVKKQATRAVELITKNIEFEAFLSPAQLKVWEVLKGGQEMSRSEIKKQINIPLPTIRQALAKLLEMNKIELKGQGRASRYVVKDLNLLSLESVISYPEEDQAEKDWNTSGLRQMAHWAKEDGDDQADWDLSKLKPTPPLPKNLSEK